jgi:hypothetical protein
MGKTPKQTFLRKKEEVQMTKKHMKKCSISLAIKEMQIKATLSLHFALPGLAAIKSTNNNKYWQI